MGWGGFPIFGLFPLLLLIALIVGAVLFARSTGRRRDAGPLQPSSALDVLNERYARGEIGRDEYLQKRADIGGAPPGPGAPT